MIGQTFLITEIEKKLADVLEIFGNLEIAFGRELDTQEQNKIEFTIRNAFTDPERQDFEAAWVENDRLWVTEAIGAIMFTPPKGWSQDKGRLIKVLEQIQNIAPLVEVYFSVNAPWDWVQQWLGSEQKATGNLFVYFGEKLKQKKQTIQVLLEDHDVANSVQWQEERDKPSEFFMIFEPIESLNRYRLLILLQKINSIASIASLSLDVTFSLGQTENAIQTRILESLESWEWEEYISSEITDVQVELTSRTEEEDDQEEDEFDEELEEGELQKRKTKHLIYKVSVTVEDEEF